MVDSLGGYPARHPYALEAKRRHSIFLRAMHKTLLAEKQCMGVALGRVEVLGPQHPFSKESVEDVKSFLCIAGRENEFSDFAAKLGDVTAKSDLRNSITRSLQFW
jgi:hypothetical protein